MNKLEKLQIAYVFLRFINKALLITLFVIGLNHLLRNDINNLIFISFNFFVIMLNDISICYSSTNVDRRLAEEKKYEN